MRAAIGFRKMRSATDVGDRVILGHTERALNESREV